MSTHTTDICWLAGVLEGDGCFTVAGKRDPRIALSMYDKDVVERAMRIMHPKTYRKNGNDVTVRQAKNRRQPTYSFRISGRRAAGWMMTLYPQMGERRQARIRELLARWLASPSRKFANTGES